MRRTVWTLAVVAFGALPTLAAFAQDDAAAGPTKTAIFMGMFVFSAMAVIGIVVARFGAEIHTRPVDALDQAEDAIGRAVEMGRPVLFVTGTQAITKAGTIAGLSILRLVAEKCAESGARLIVPCIDTIVTSIARETVEDAYRRAGRGGDFQPEDVFFISRRQLAYTAGVNGIMEREHPATVFLQGEFSAESLIFGETGRRAGAMLIAGTDKETQLPFFVTTCDATLIGEELYAAGAAISQDRQLLGSLRGVDLGRYILAAVIIIGVLLNVTGADAIRKFLGG